MEIIIGVLVSVFSAIVIGAAKKFCSSRWCPNKRWKIKFPAAFPCNAPLPHVDLRGSRSVR